MKDFNVRDQVAQAAVELFAEKGYANTSVQEVVERAGVTKGAMYHYFGSKDDLLYEIYARVLREQNYTGFISSEYEAHAYSDRYNAFDQIRAQHDMLKRLLEAQPAAEPAVAR